MEIGKSARLEQAACDPGKLPEIPPLTKHPGKSEDDIVGLVNLIHDMHNI